jgi:hypothetical protein
MSATGDPQAASLKVGCGLDAGLAIVFAPRGAASQLASFLPLARRTAVTCQQSRATRLNQGSPLPHPGTIRRSWEQMHVKIDHLISPVPALAKYGLCRRDDRQISSWHYHNGETSVVTDSPRWKPDPTQAKAKNRLDNED